MVSTATKLIAACAALTGATAVFAHEGHGLGGSHWHASDTLGFVVVVALAAVALWLSRK
ncbi:MAG: hypothetical protein U1E71_10755 [Ramlibacter sp.]